MENLCGAEHLRLTKLPGLTLFTRKKFASPPSLMTHNSSETFQLKLYALDKKKKKKSKKKKNSNRKTKKQTNQCAIFQIFEGSNGSSPNSSCHLWSNRVAVYSNFAFIFSVIKDNSSVFFLAQTLDRKSPSKWNFWFESSSNFSCHIWNHMSYFSLDFASLFRIMRDKSSVLF